MQVKEIRLIHHQRFGKNSSHSRQEKLLDERAEETILKNLNLKKVILTAELNSEYLAREFDVFLEHSINVNICRGHALY